MINNNLPIPPNTTIAYTDKRYLVLKFLPGTDKALEVTVPPTLKRTTDQGNFIVVRKGEIKVFDDNGDFIASRVAGDTTDTVTHSYNGERIYICSDVAESEFYCIIKRDGSPVHRRQRRGASKQTTCTEPGLLFLVEGTATVRKKIVTAPAFIKTPVEISEVSDDAWLIVLS